MLKKALLLTSFLIYVIAAMSQNFKFDGGIGDYRRSAKDGFVADLYDTGTKELIIGSEGGIYDYSYDNGKFVFYRKLLSIPDTQRIIKLQYVDLNGDNLPDIVYLQQIEPELNRLAWLKNSGNGNFDTMYVITYLSEDYKTFYTRDFDWDWDSDIVVLGGKELVLAINSGNGTFDTTRTNYSSYDAWGLDIFAYPGTTCYTNVVFSTAQKIMYSCYRDSLEGPYEIELNADMPAHLAFSDFDQDGDLDFAATDSRGKIILYQYDDYWFEDTLLADTSVFSEARGAFAVDWDSDGDDDLIISRYTYSNLFLMKNQGSNNFQEPIELKSANFPVFSFTNRLIIQDLDRDSDMDIINTSYETLESPALSIAHNENGHFDHTQILIPDKRFTHIEFCDINSDGQKDMFVVPKTYDFPSFWLKTATGWDNITKLPDAFVRLSYATLADLDGDGDLDILAIRDSLLTDHTDIVVLENISFNFNTWIEHTVGRYYALKKLQVIPKTNDLPDFAAYKDDTILLFSNNGNFDFENTQIYVANDSIADIDVGDFDADGQTDIILADGYDIKILFGSSFNNAVKVDSSHTDVKFSALKTGDLNKDGIPDFVAAEMYPHFALNQGNNNFDITVKWFIHLYHPANIALADIDANGYSDFISASYKNNIYYALNDSGQFLSYEFQTPGKPWMVYAFDYDYDNDIDLMYISSDQDSLIFIRNRKLQFLQQPHDTSACAGTRAIIGTKAEADKYKWFYALAGETNFVAVPDNDYFDGVSTDTLIIKRMESWLDQSRYFCQIILENDTLSSDTVVLSLTEDSTAPELRTVTSYSVYLDQNGQGSLTANDLILYADDNCALKDTTVSVIQFDCNDLGINEVSITVTDWSGNSSTEWVEVEVFDTIDPQISCPSNTQVETSYDYYTVSGNEFDANVTDNCSIFDFYAKINDTGFYSLTLDGVNLPIGQNKIQWFVTDDSYNGSSCTFYVTVNRTTTALDGINDLKIYPNPVSDILFVQGFNVFPGKIILSDATGKVLIEKTITSDKMPVSLRDLPSGIYLLQIQAADMFLTQKIIKK